jgi:hypothetical protein
MSHKIVDHPFFVSQQGKDGPRSHHEGNGMLERFNFGFAVEMSKNADRSHKSTGKRKVSAL